MISRDQINTRKIRAAQAKFLPPMLPEDVAFEARWLSMLAAAGVPDKPNFTVTEIARIVGVCKQTIRNAIKRFDFHADGGPDPRDIEGYKAPYHFRVARDAFRLWFRACGAYIQDMNIDIDPPTPPIVHAPNPTPPPVPKPMSSVRTLASGATRHRRQAPRPTREALVLPSHATRKS